MLRYKKFSFPKGCNIGELVMRETNGVDEQRAAMLADTRGERSNTYQEMIRLAIVSVDGQGIVQPFTLLDEWNSKTRALVRSAFDSLNDLTEDEVADFLLNAEAVAPATEKRGTTVVQPKRKERKERTRAGA